MNDLHLKFKMGTGGNVYHEAETIKYDENYLCLSDYIEWLEENLSKGGF